MSLAGRDVPNERVDLADLEAVEVGARFADLVFGGTAVDDEHESVVVLDRLDRVLTGQRVLDDRVLVPRVNLLGADARVARLLREHESTRSAEGHGLPDLVRTLLVRRFLNSDSCFLCLCSF